MSLINAAKNWRQVGPQLRHEVVGTLTGENRPEIESDGSLTLKVRIQILL